MVITDETIDYVGILAKLELSDEEKEQAKKLRCLQVYVQMKSSCCSATIVHSKYFIYDKKWKNELLL